MMIRLPTTLVGLILVVNATLIAQEPTVEVTPRPKATNRSNATSADVIVYGATPGELCAAIAAAHEGASVILLEPTDHIGGMSTGGLSHCDSNQMVRSTVMGLFDEWHTRVVKDYTDRGFEAPYNPAKKDQTRWTFEPHVAMRVTLRIPRASWGYSANPTLSKIGDNGRPTDYVFSNEQRHVHCQSFCGRNI